MGAFNKFSSGVKLSSDKEFAQRETINVWGHGISRFYLRGKCPAM